MDGWIDVWMYGGCIHPSLGHHRESNTRAGGEKKGGGTKDEEEDVRASERAMAAHQMPTTAAGMPHPSAVIPPQYAHSQPQVVCRVFFAEKSVEKRANSVIRRIGWGSEKEKYRDGKDKCFVVVVWLLFVAYVSQYGGRMYTQ
jgi:hypothetical protein